MKKLLLLSILLLNIFLIGTVQAQQLTITGTVTDAKTNEPLPGVNIAILSTRGGTATNGEGQYELTLPANADSLQFSFVGYTTKRIAINGRTVINVVLQQDVQQLGEELVVTAFGVKQSKKALGYSTQSVSGEEISATQQNNVVSALQGKLAGVQIQNSSGAVGAGTSIVIRGLTSLNPGADNQPLFVVDGIPISNDTQSSNVLPSTGSNATGSDEQFSFTNRGADINPDDIQSINILKGPGATALYGLRAANGVVVITTKSGSAGPTNINFKSAVGFSQPDKYPELQDTYREGYAGQLRFYADGTPLRFQTYGPVRSANDPFYNNDKNFFQTGQNLKNYISVSGGSDKATYFTSVSRNDEIGIVPNSDYSKTTALLRGSTHFGDKLDVTGSVQFTNDGGNRASGGDKSILSNLSYQSSTFDINDYIDENGNPINYSGGIIDNARYAAEVKKFNDDVNRVIGHVGFNYTFTNWLSLDYKFGLDYFNDKRTVVVPPGLDESSQVNGFIAKSNIDHNEINSTVILTAEHSFSDDLHATLKLGNNINQRRNSQVYVRGEGFTLPDFNDLSNTTNFFPSQSNSLERIIGAFADAQFDYNETFYLTLTGRNDWTSTLPKNNRSFFYPSASLGYIFTQSFNNDHSFLDYGKLRLSVARVGKDASPYQIGQYYINSPDFPFAGVNGFEISSVAGSENLKPEQTTSTELGTDLRFFNDRLELDASVYRKLSDHQIFEIPVSNTTGLSRLISNAGEIENKGLEILLKGTPIRSSDFFWNVSLNWSTSRGVVKTLPEGIDEIPFYTDRITNKLVKGGDVGDLYGYTFNRNDNGQLIIGDDGFPLTNLDEQVKVGNAFPKWQGGITNTFNYKNVSLSFLVDVRQGGDKYDLGLRDRLRNGIDQRTDLRYQQVIFKGVTQDGQPNTKPAEITGVNYYRDAYRYNNAADVILQDASWVRLRNLSISYSLSSAAVEKLPIKSAEFSLTGNNLLLATPYRGYDPEARQFGSGSNIYGYTGLNIPPTRSITFSINLLF